MNKLIHIIGAGMAGSETAWQLAQSGIKVILHEMRPVCTTEAHHTDKCAELVCSNSFRSDDADYNAVGLLHEEMRRAESLIIRCGDKTKVPAGSALAVDREAFSEAVTKELHAHPNITIERKEITELPLNGQESVIIATGPLTSPTLAEAIGKLTGENNLALFDAIGPIVLR